MDLNCVLAALFWLPRVKSICNDPYCAVCISAGSICDECKPSFTVRNNSCSPCPKNCLTCSTDDNCQSCSPGFWGYQCRQTCLDNCNEAGCEMVSGYCLKCKIGWYGPVCREECNRCENDQCGLLNCTTGCKEGYFPDTPYRLPTCIKCPLFCQKCSNASFCTQCYTGHYINQYTAPAGIVATCLNCSSAVSECVDCNYDQNQVFCRSCEEGYVVNQDNQCVTTVSCNYCQNGCDSEGRCFGGCQPGLLGTKCEYKCSYACNTCINQDACLSCKDDFYTQTCNVPCNANCKSGNNPRCRFLDGYCSNGCNKGFWGNQCENNCNNNCLDITTASDLCHRNGTCYYGCKSGYMGSDCSQVSSTSPSPLSKSALRTSTTTVSTILTSTDKTTTLLTQTKADVKATETNVQTVSDNRGALGPAIGGSFAGVFVLGVLAVVVVFYLRKRNLQKEKDRTRSNNVYYNVSMSTSHEERSQSGTDRHPDRKDMVELLASASNQCEATLYEMLSERNKGNLYDHLEQPSVKEIRKEVAELGSSVEYYNI